MVKQSSSEETIDRLETIYDTAPLPLNAAAQAEVKRSPADRYGDDVGEKLDRLYDAAPDSPHRIAFVDALAGKLASITFVCGPFAAGDIVRRYGTSYPQPKT